MRNIRIYKIKDILMGVIGIADNILMNFRVFYMNNEKANHEFDVSVQFRARLLTSLLSNKIR